MMACNDLALANEGLAYWKEAQAGVRRSRKIAGSMYFIRLELSHLYEALRIVEQIEKTDSLRDLINQCDSRTRESYAEIKKYVHGGEKRARFQKLVGQLRHNLTFHYDQTDKLVTRAIEERASKPETRISSVTRADTMHDWRFSAAEEVVDSIVVRQIWNIPRDADLRDEADKIADEVHGVLLRFVDFAGEFIWKYIEQ